MELTIISMVIVSLAGIGLTLARRYKNSMDNEAGMYIAGGTMIILFAIWFIKSAG